MKFDPRVVLFALQLVIAATVAVTAATRPNGAWCAWRGRCASTLPTAFDNPCAPNALASLGRGDILCAFVPQKGAEAPCTGIRPEDGDWRHRVSPGIRDEDAYTIVRAIREGDILNRLPRPPSGIAAPMPFIDPGQVSSIRLNGVVGEREVYSVQTGCRRGRVYIMVIVDGKVQLHDVRWWIA